MNINEKMEEKAFENDVLGVPNVQVEEKIEDSSL